VIYLFISYLIEGIQLYLDYINIQRGGLGSHCVANPATVWCMSHAMTRIFCAKCRAYFYV